MGELRSNQVSEAQMEETPQIMTFPKLKIRFVGQSTFSRWVGFELPVTPSREERARWKRETYVTVLVRLKLI